MITADILDIQAKALDLCSPKEKMFYRFLMDLEADKSFVPATSTEQLCFDAFVLGLSESDALAKLQRSKPVKNIHYSANLIELIAAAKIDYESERDHVDSYLVDHSLKDAYLFYLVLGGELTVKGSIDGPLDRLVEKIVIQKLLDGVPALFVDALSNSNHIFDVIILRKLYENYLSIHPRSDELLNLDHLKTITFKTSKALNGVVMLTITILCSLPVVKYLNWYLENPKENEALQKYLLSVSSTLLWVAIFLGLTIPDKVKALTWMRYKVLQSFYYALGIKYSDIEKILKSKDV